MSAPSSYSIENTAAREELLAFIRSLSDKELTHPMPAGWTPAAVLGHLAFWDQRALTLIRKWQQEGITPSLNDTDVVNEASRPICLAVAPQAAIQLFIRVAEELDAVIAALDPAFISRIETDGKTVHLNRAEHRRMHLQEIKEILNK